MLVQYADKQCVSITVIKGKSGPAASLNSKRYEEQQTIFYMGDDVVYSIDVQGVLFDSQQGASQLGYMPTQGSSYQRNKQIVVVETGEEYVITQQSFVPVVPINSDEQDLGQKIIDLKRKKPAVSVCQMEELGEEDEMFYDSESESDSSECIIEPERKKPKNPGPTTRSHCGEGSSSMHEDYQ
jgi:hypothetical protein